MAIVITSSETGGYRKYGIGMPLQITWDFTLLADATDKFLFIDFAIWLTKGYANLAPISGEGLIPSTGYMYVHDGSTTEYELELIPGTYSDKWKNVKATIQFPVDNLNGKIRLTFLHTMDVKKWISQSNNLLNDRRVFHNHWANPTPLDETGVSVYQSGGTLRDLAVKVVLSSSGYTVDDVGVNAISESHVFWNADVNFQAANWIFKRSGLTVTTLSTAADTDIEFRADEKWSGTVEDEYFIGVVKVTPAPDEIADFASEIPVYVGKAVTGLSLTGYSPIPYQTGGADFFTPTELFAVESGSTYLLKGTINKDILEPGSWYRVYVLIQDVVPDTNDPWNPYCSQLLYVPEEAPPVDYDPTPEVRTYHHDDPTPAASCILQAIPGERAYCKSVISKADYLTAIGSAGIAGDFDNNYLGVEVWLVSTMPTETFVPAAEEIIIPEITDGSTEYEVEATFRVPMDWEDKIRFCIIKYRFMHNGQEDFIIQPFQISSQVEEFTSLLDGIWLRDGIEVDEVCKDAVEGDLITLRVETTLTDWKPYILHLRNGEVEEEYDFTNSDNLPDLLDGPIVSVTETTPGNKLIDIVLKENELDLEDCFRVLLKQDYVQGGSGTCPCITVDFTGDYAVGQESALVSLDGTITPDGGQTITEIYLVFMVQGVTFEDYVTPTTSFGVQVYVPGDWENYGGFSGFLYLMITMDDGCVYTNEGQFTIYNIDDVDPPNPNSWDLGDC